MSDEEKCALESCGKTFSKTKGGIRCRVCLQWFHPNCAGMSVDLVKSIKNCKARIQFTCVCCIEAQAENTDVELIRKDLKFGLDSIRESMKAIETKLENRLKTVEDDVKNCCGLIKAVENDTQNKLRSLEDQNEVLHKRLNQADMIVNGFPRNYVNMKAEVLKICDKLNVDIDAAEISLCSFINNGHSVLVKFKSIDSKLSVMANYYKFLKTNSLKLGDFVEIETNGIDKRIYLNDHLSPKAEQLAFLCRSLRRAKRIKKFKLLSSDVPRVKIVHNNDSTGVYDLVELSSTFEVINLLPRMNHHNVPPEQVSATQTSNAIRNCTRSMTAATSAAK